MITRTAIALLSASGILLVGTASTLAAPEERGNRADRLERMIERLDADQSGAISLEEFARRSNERFATEDANGDGTVTTEEREAAREAHAAQREEKKSKRKDKKGKRGEERLAQIDTNKDGAVSREEHDAFQQKRFADMDSDGDGQVTAAEFTENAKSKRGGSKGKRG